MFYYFSQLGPAWAQPVQVQPEPNLIEGKSCVCRSPSVPSQDAVCHVDDNAVLKIGDGQFGDLGLKTIAGGFDRFGP